MKKCIFLIIGLLFFPHLAGAVTISPPVLELEANPGETIQTKVKLYNETDENIYLNGYVQIFQPKGESGEAAVLSPEIGSQAADWLKLPLNAAVLRPDEIIEVPLYVVIPKTADVGGYYLAVTWEVSGSELKSDQLGINSKAANLVLLKVKGQALEKLSISEFNLASSKKIYSRLPICFYARLENTGNIHLKPQGFLVIRNMFGRVSQTVPLNEDGSHVLPGSIRKFEMSWNKGVVSEGNFWIEIKNEIKQFAIGRYAVQVQLEYGEKRERLVSEEISFWVMPWRLLAILAVVIVIVVFFKLKSRKRD